MSYKKTISRLSSIVVFSGITFYCYATLVCLQDVHFGLTCIAGEQKLVPAAICRTYMLNIGPNQQDIAQLNAIAGANITATPPQPEFRDIYEKLLKRWIDKGLDINAQHFSAGSTALHSAAFDNNFTGTQLLLKYGASPFIKDRKLNQTAREYAIWLDAKPQLYKNRLEIIKLLEQAEKSKQ